MLLSLKEAPLEFELMAAWGRYFTHLLLDSVEFAYSYAELRVFYGVEAVDAGRRTWETYFDDYLDLKSACEAEEELRAIMGPQGQNFSKICLADWCKISKQSGGCLHV